MAIQHGMNQQTPAVQNTLSVLRTQRVSARRMKTPAQKRYASSLRGAKKSRKRSAGSSKRRASSGRSPARLVKGSAAAKAYMAKIRRLRKK